MIRGINLHFQDPWETPQSLHEIQSLERSKEIAETVIKYFNAVRIWYSDINKKLELPFHKSILKTLHNNGIKFIVNVPNHWRRRSTKEENKQVINDFDKFDTIYCTANELYDERGYPDYNAALKAEQDIRKLTSKPTLYANHPFLNRTFLKTDREFPFTHADIIGYNLYAPLQALGWKRVITDFSKITGRKAIHCPFEWNAPIFFGFRPMLNTYMRLAKRLKKQLILTETGLHTNYNFIKKHIKLFNKLNIDYMFIRYDELTKNILKLFRI